MSRYKGGVVDTISSREYYGLNNSQDIYKGTSFKFSGKWAPGVHYFNDEYIVDFVTYNGKLWACARNNFSSEGNAPSSKSRYWDFVIGSMIDENGNYSNFDLNDVITNNSDVEVAFDPELEKNTIKVKDDILNIKWTQI